MFEARWPAMTVAFALSRVLRVQLAILNVFEGIAFGNRGTIWQTQRALGRDNSK